jgi:DNA-binding NarL/FixJ family response regulator
LSLARAFARANRSDAARRASEHAATLFARLGAGAAAAAVGPAVAGGGAAAAGAAAGSNASPAPPPSPLTARERDVLRLVAGGLADKEIAARLSLSPHTIHRHVSNILSKLDLPSRAAAVAHAAKLGLLE